LTGIPSLLAGRRNLAGLGIYRQGREGRKGKTEGESALNLILTGIVPFLRALRAFVVKRRPGVRNPTPQILYRDDATNAK
jgi:hypothetical protein